MTKKIKKKTKSVKKAHKKQKFVVWLHNYVDGRDDDWKSIYAYSANEAAELVEFDSSRFSKGAVYTTKEFRSIMGFSA